jgi:hypothetical protein
VCHHHCTERRLPGHPTGRIKEVAQHLFTNERDIALALAEVGQVDRIEALLNLGDGLAQGPLDIELLVAYTPSRRPEQVFIAQDQLMRFQDHAAVALIALFELALEPLELHVGERNRFVETHQLGSDFLGQKVTTRGGLTTAIDDKGLTDGDSGGSGDSGSNLGRKRTNGCP